MEQINKLIELVNTLKKWCEQAQKGKTLAEVDEAKVEGLKNYQETLRQTNRAFHDLQTISRERRAELTTASIRGARALARTPVTEDLPKVDTERTSVEVKKTAKTTEKKPKSKKAKK